MWPAGPWSALEDLLTMLVQALANVIYLGLNCRVLMGPVCLPSRIATFIPLSVLHTWTLPSSEPADHYTGSIQQQLQQ